jgi:fermentation-respiration switch protein FrsA (DUF1100 family)
MLAKQYPASILASNRDTPIMAYHGKSDGVVTLDRAQASYTILKNAGCNVDFTIEPGLAHSLRFVCGDIYLYTSLLLLPSLNIQKVTRYFDCL